MRELDGITGAIIENAIRIHRQLGPGLLESVYVRLMERALTDQGLTVERQKLIPIEYEGHVFEEAFRADLVVDSRVIVEIKSADRLAPVHTKQLLTYLKLARLPVGLLINFGGATLHQGLKRVVNALEPSASPRLRVNRVKD